ncbi:MAG: [LysW]-aminoadipate kinase [Candidatus Helarchaeota archaeon]
MTLLVVKIGGKLISQEAEVSKVLDDIANLHKANQIILAHGGGPQINELLKKLGKSPVMVKSPSGMVSRYTDAETRDIAEMVMGGKINKDLVALLQSRGIPAVGLSGIDGAIIRAKKKDKLMIIDETTGKKRILRGDCSGKIEKINTKLLSVLLENGYLPVISALAISESHEPLNIDGDRAALYIGSALKADKLVLLTDVEGIILNNEVVKTVGREEIDSLMEKVKGGMRKKLFASKEAINKGLKEIIIASGLVDQPISSALTGDIGTSISWKHL